MPRSAAAVEGLRHNPQVRYIQRMVIGPPPVTAAENAQPAWPEAAAPPPPPSAFRVSANATTSWTTGSYTYDGSGNISGIGPGTELQTNAYVYDRIGRLSSATIYNGTQKHEESYVHDPAGNLTQLTKDGVTLSFPVDPATNWLAASLAAYDAVGNTTWMAGAGAYTYDQLGMIASNDVDAYIYTADDERLAVGRMPDDPTWRWTLRDLNGRVVREFESFGLRTTGQYFVWVEDHFFADGVLVASEREVAEGGRRHFHVDHLGTPRMVTDAGGNRVSAHVYAPYGRELTSVQQERARGFSREQPLRFTGHERDGLNDLSNEEHTQYLDYMHARFYNPNWGRFLSVDPVLETKKALREPQRWNRYSYALNNPIRYTDPTGKVVAGAQGVAEEIKERKLQAKQVQLEAYAKQLAAQVKSGGIDSKLAMNLYWNRAVNLNQPVTAKGSKPTAEQLTPAKENALLIATGAALNFGVVRGSRAAVGDAITGGSMGADTLHHFCINAINTYDGVPVRLQRFGASELRGENDVRDVAANNNGAVFGDLLQRNPSAQPSDVIP